MLRPIDRRPLAKAHDRAAVEINRWRNENMMRHILLTCAALAALTFAPAARAAEDDSSGPAVERMQHWAADHEAMLDAKLAGLKAGLRLTSDQEKLWPSLETARSCTWSR
jgi:hypothetical protein